LAIDLWSVGCVIGEMLLGGPLFTGECTEDQLVEIIKLLGTPTTEQILNMNENYLEFNFPTIKPSSWNQIFKREMYSESEKKDYKEIIFKFLSNILVYEPNLRIHPLVALLDPFFD